MPPEAVPWLEIDPARIGRLELAEVVVPYVDLRDFPSVCTRLRVGDAEYAYDRSYPIRGGSAVMPAAVVELQAVGRQVLVAERDERYYVYLALRA